MDDVDNKSEGQPAILNLYAALGVSIVLSFLPMLSAAILSLVFFTGVLIAGYVMRGKVEHGSLLENHCTFIIRTLWITALFSLITTAIATAYMMSRIDYGPFEPCANALANKGLVWMEQAGTMEVYALVEPCVESFIGFNETLLINAVVIAGGPLLLYLGYRMIKGVSRAVKGYRLADPQSWF